MIDDHRLAKSFKLQYWSANNTLEICTICIFTNHLHISVFIIDNNEFNNHLIIDDIEHIASIILDELYLDHNDVIWYQMIKKMDVVRKSPFKQYSIRKVNFEVVLSNCTNPSWHRPSLLPLNETAILDAAIMESGKSQIRSRKQAISKLFPPLRTIKNDWLPSAKMAMVD